MKGNQEVNNFEKNEIGNLICKVTVPFGFKNKYFATGTELLYLRNEQMLYGVDFKIRCTTREFEGIEPNIKCGTYRKLNS